MNFSFPRANIRDLNVLGKYTAARKIPGGSEKILNENKSHFKTFIPLKTTSDQYCA